MTATIAQWEQLPMYAVSDELDATVEELGLRQNLDDLQRDGFTVVPVGRELTDRVRTAVLRLAQDGRNSTHGFELTCGQPLGADPAIDEAVTHPVALALAEYMCGRGCTLSALLATVREQGGGTLPLHADQSYLPEPFPEHNVTLTACWVTDDFTMENGATMVVPGSHVGRRRPSPDETRSADGAVPIECPAGSVALWDGSVWHGSLPRQTPGERVVLHVTYTRLAYRTFHDFGYVGDEYREAASSTMRQLLGADLGFGTNDAHRHFDMARYGAMSANVLR